jgi:hypothetical protein
MRSIGRCFKWVGRKYRDSVAPVLADYWYAARHHSFGGFGGGGKGEGEDGDEDEDLADIGNSLEYQQKIPAKWTQRDVVAFICQEVTMGDIKEFRICRLTMEVAESHGDLACSQELYACTPL